MYLTPDDVRALACPVCGGGLRFGGELGAGRRIDSGSLDCTQCGRAWPVRRGLAHLLEERGVHSSDWWLRWIYDVIAPTHDLGVMLALPLMQFPDPGASRNRYMERMDLGSLEARPDGPPLRVLEVGIGSGGNLPLVERDLPGALQVELWGLDMSPAMLRECDRRARWYTGRRVRLVLGDAHALPFPDHSFDRVFHVGGINGYGDPARALAEMARVARPATPIVVVDEHLDPKRFHLPHHYLNFWALTWLDPDPRPPVKHLPAEARYEVSRVSRFYYCLTFWVPAAAAPETPHAARGSPRTEARGEPSGLADDMPDRQRRSETMADISTVLNGADLTAITGGFDAGEMNKKLREFFSNTYPATKDWLDALEKAFNTAHPIEVADRERVIVALLASRGRGFELALHMYVAVANGVTPEEIAHIVFLTGIYAGVDTFARALAIGLSTMAILKDLTKGGAQPSVADVYDALRKGLPA
jgi:ubiquinone/menaquinone biosynthesis C-methylase UbiE/alkylhydroperoxidase/carboxymuconolactone decarboxylase family protein YurZ/uncharacterized protein YbaR (Trm112 family)